MRFSFALKIWLAISLLAVGITSLSVAYFYFNSSRLVFEQLGKRLHSIATISALLFAEPERAAIRRLREAIAADLLPLHNEELRALPAGGRLTGMLPEAARTHMQSDGFLRLVKRLQQIKSSSHQRLPRQNSIAPPPQRLPFPPLVRRAYLYLAVPQATDSRYVRLLAESSGTKSAQPAWQVGDVLALPEKTTIFRDIFNNDGACAALCVEPEEMDGRRVLSAAVPLRDTDGRLLAVLGLDMQAGREIEEVAQLRLHALLIILMALLLSLFLAFVLAHRLGKPLRELERAARQAREHNFTTEVAIQRNDEIGHLAQAFNALLGEIRHYAGTLEEKNRALRQLDEIKDDFIAATAQDLSEPLEEISNLAASLSEGAVGTQSAATRANLNLIAASTYQLIAQVKDLQDFAHLRHDSLILHRKPVSLREVCELVLSMNRPLVGFKPIQLLNDVSADAPLVFADENRLQQILHNLVNNAIKYTDTGRIIIHAEPLPEARLGVRVCDSGIGIAAEAMPGLFDSLLEVNKSWPHHEQHKLGLAITRQLVRLHGGDIQVQSTPGQGSCFCFTLPLSVAEKNAAIEDKPLLATPPPAVLRQQSPPTAGQPILIVDDDPISRQVMVNQLSLHQYPLMQAANGIEALDLLAKDQIPALMIVDAMMPRMTGYEVTRKVRETWERHELPILLLTSRDQVPDRVRGLELGANDFLLRPVDKDELLARIKAHLHIRELEASLVRTRDEALEANLGKSRFIANLNHELRTPLNAIIGYSDLLMDGSTEMGEQDVSEALREIYQSGQSLLEVINDLLNIAALEAGTIRVTANRFWLNELLSEVLAEREADLSKNENQFEKQCLAESSGIELYTDEEKLRYVLRALLHNAAKFTQQGKIAIHCREYRKDNKPWLEILVEDNGMGISQEQLPYLFRPFVQLNNGNNRPFAGIGLGLAVSQGFVRLLGGDITAQSELGRGSRFYLHLPMRRQVQSPPPN